jgi:hypothetical protein
MNLPNPDPGEVLLLLIGVLLSISLLFMFFIPFVARMRVRRWVRVTGLDVDQAATAVCTLLERLDYIVLEDETDDAGVCVVKLRRVPGTFSLTFTPAEAGVELTVVQDGLTASDFRRMTVLTGTAIAFLATRVHRALNQAGGQTAWRLKAKGKGPTLATPVRGIFRPFIDLSPWH